MQFVQELAVASEKLNHHPEWRNSYRRLDICLCTHDAGNAITEKDHALSAEINRLLLSYRFENC
jgi:4a-hydroxytetrahydrobiopterin dehydratase